MLYQEEINFFSPTLHWCKNEQSFFVMLLAFHIHSRSTLEYFLSLIFHFFANFASIMETGCITHQWWNKVVELKFI